MDHETVTRDEKTVSFGTLPRVSSSLVHILSFVFTHYEATDAFYVDLEQFLHANENYKMLEVGDDFVTHHFTVDKYHIWGVTAYALVLVATLVHQRTPQFPVYRYEEYFDLQKITKQQKDFFRLCVDLRYRDKTRENNKEKSRL
ncbi:unnamed protein product [Adineta ricciae]|uniref:Uncharacterized protein n=1 Tax=Adineta ricciae TaxID=249248 RepID=A0A815KC51_ADIRI|nr:unnamed protein product [Adineta ricciae]